MAGDKDGIKENEGQDPMLQISTSIRKHDAALDALKDVPTLLAELAKKVGINPGIENENKSKKPDWSLGLSDEEDDIDIDQDANKIIGNETDPKDDELKELLKDTEMIVEFGPSVSQDVCNGFTKTVSRQLTKESRAALREKIQIPENCKQFAVPKVNAEIWRLLPSQAKIYDIKQQQNQQVLSLTLSSLTTIANTMAENKAKIPNDVVRTVIKQAIDGANLMGDQFQGLTSKRRFEMKKFLNPEYAGICSGQFPNSEWLFGTDLAESLKSTKATSSLMKSTMNTFNTGRFHPYSQRGQGQQGSQRHLNFNRPSYPQFRGSGQHQPRFSRPQGQNRPFQRNQSSNYNQYNRFQKM